MGRVFNFYAGPATLPEEILKEAQAQLVDYKGNGLSIMETSHRSKMYDEVHTQAVQDIKDFYNVPENFEVLFLQGGASSQFYMIPMNFLAEGESADYIDTGAWAKKAVKEVGIIGRKANVIASSAETNYDRIPTDFSLTPGAKYLYVCSNNTIYGTEYHALPETNGVPLIVDASSDIFSAPIDWKNIGMVYAGAQKNAGPSGVTIVIIRKDLIESKNTNIPTMLRYQTHAEKDSLFNTPPTFNIYMVGLNAKWLKSFGTIEDVRKRNQQKAGFIYDVIDNSDGYYKGHALKEFRSLMNITFNLPNADLEAKFVKEATELQLLGLKGHRSVGGIRASTYNALPVEGCETLASFMKDFMKNNG